MTTGYIIAQHGIFFLRVEGETFSKWFAWIRDARAYAKAHDIEIHHIFEAD